MNWGWHGAAVMALAGCTAAAQVSIDTVETWSGSGTSGWTNRSTDAAVTNPGGHLNFTHRTQGMPAPAADIAGVAIPPGTRLTNVTFRFLAEDVPPSAVRLCLHASQSGNLWYAPLVAPTACVEVAYSVPVDFHATRWIMGPDSRAETFQDDLRLADWVGVYVRRHADTAAQDYRIDDFRLQGVYTDDVDGDGIPNAWEMAFDLDPDGAGDRDDDPDRDGMGNYGEYRSGTRPQDAGSVLKLSVAGSPSGNGVVLTWPSADGRTYTLWSATNLTEQMTPVDTGIPAEPDTNRYPTATAPRSAVYRVSVE